MVWITFAPTKYKVARADWAGGGAFGKHGG